MARERESRLTWIVVVDTDGDGRVDDEALLRDYHVAWDVFALQSPHAPDSRSMMAWTVTVRDEEDWLGRFDSPTVEFHHDTGAHGHAMGFNYNGKLRSAEILLRPDGTVKLIRRREEMEDYFATLDFAAL